MLSSYYDKSAGTILANCCQELSHVLGASLTFNVNKLPPEWKSFPFYPAGSLPKIDSSISGAKVSECFKLTVGKSLYLGKKRYEDVLNGYYPCNSEPEGVFEVYPRNVGEGNRLNSFSNSVLCFCDVTNGVVLRYGCKTHDYSSSGYANSQGYFVTIKSGIPEVCKNLVRRGIILLNIPYFVFDNKAQCVNEGTDFYMYLSETSFCGYDFPMLSFIPAEWKGVSISANFLACEKVTRQNYDDLKEYLTGKYNLLLSNNLYCAVNKGSIISLYELKRGFNVFNAAPRHICDVPKNSVDFYQSGLWAFFREDSVHSVELNLDNPYCKFFTRTYSSVYRGATSYWLAIGEHEGSLYDMDKSVYVDDGSDGYVQGIYRGIVETVLHTSSGVWASSDYYFCMPIPESTAILKALKDFNFYLSMSNTDRYILKKLSGSIKPITRKEKEILWLNSQPFSYYAERLLGEDHVKLLVNSSCEKVGYDSYCNDSRIREVLDNAMRSTAKYLNQGVGICFRNGYFIMVRPNEMPGIH
jgi:hypothetical protein